MVSKAGAMVIGCGVDAGFDATGGEGITFGVGVTGATEIVSFAKCSGAGPSCCIAAGCFDAGVTVSEMIIGSDAS